MSNRDIDAVCDAFVVSNMLGGKSHGKCGNVSYANTMFYSYSTVVAKFAPIQRVFLVTSKKYSVSTSRHVRKVYNRAMSTAWGVDTRRVFEVPNVMHPEAEENMHHFIERAKGALVKATNARANAQWYYGIYLDSIARAREYSAVFTEVPFDEADFDPHNLLTEKQIARLVRKKVLGEIKD